MTKRIKLISQIISQKLTLKKKIGKEKNMLTSSEETLRHDGGPLEKNHLKDMVQRNALETLVFNKITKHIETEKKAFTRQNSRDETEMKHLMLRLHQEQQAFIQDGEQLSSGKLNLHWNK